MLKIDHITTEAMPIIDMVGIIITKKSKYFRDPESVCK